MNRLGQLGWDMDMRLDDVLDDIGGPQVLDNVQGSITMRTPSMDKALVPLADITRAKFGQAGINAIAKYPFLIDSKIHPDLYMVEGDQKDSAGNATSFKFKWINNDNVLMEIPVSRMGNTVKSFGATIWTNKSNTMLYIGAGIAALVVIGLVLWKVNG